MPVDHSIYLQQQTPDILGNVTRGIQQGMSMRDMVDKRALSKQKLEQEKQYKQTLANSIDESGNLRAGSMADLIKADPERAIKDKQTFGNIQQNEMQTQRLGLQQKMDQVGAISQVLGPANDDPSWQAGIEQLKKMGLDTSDLSPVYDPNHQKFVVGKALTAAQRLAEQARQEQFDYTKKKDDRAHSLAQQELSAKQQKLQSETRIAGSKAAAELRKERSGLPTTKATQEVSAAFNKIQSAVKNPSPAGDLALIFNYMKMLDPGSTVREGEFANAQNSAGIPDRVRAQYNQIISGERLAEPQRMDFFNQSKGLYQSQMDIQNQADQTFVDLAQQAGIDPQQVLINFQANNYEPPAQLSSAQKKTWFDALKENMGVVGPQKAHASQPMIMRTQDIEWAD